MKTQTITEILAGRALSDVNALQVRQAKELAAKAAAEIATAKKFWSMWDTEDRRARMFTFETRAHEMKAKAEELAAGKFEAQHDFSAIVMTYVTAIRELSGNL